MITAKKCNRPGCGCYIIRADRPLDEATYQGQALWKRTIGTRVVQVVNGAIDSRFVNAWEIRYAPVGAAQCDGCTYDPTPDVDHADPGRALTPEDRFDIDGTGKAVITRVVRAVTFNTLAAANAGKQALVDAINTAAQVADLDGASMANYLASLGPFKHPTLSQWAIVLKPRFRAFFTDRAKALLVRDPATPFDGIVMANYFWTTDAATTLTRYNQLLQKLANFTDLDPSWGL